MDEAAETYDIIIKGIKAANFAGLIDVAKREADALGLYGTGFQVHKVAFFGTIDKVPNVAYYSDSGILTANVRITLVKTGE